MPAVTDNPVDPLGELSFGERAAIGRIEKALFGGGDRLVKVGRYEIHELIGAGAFGKVYRARDPELARDVALKVTDALADVRDRDELLREARALATIAHPNVVAVFDAGVIEDGDRARVFIAMELVSGGNLRRWLATTVRRPADVLEVMRQAGRGLWAAHQAGIVHRDVKPDNILIGAEGRARVVDFGLARLHDPAIDDERAPPPQRLVGTPAYSAPEQLAGGATTPAADQFALCATAWEAIYGERPYPGATLAAVREAFARPLAPPARRAVGRRAQRALERGLAVDPAARFPSVGALLAALDARARWVVPVALAVTAVAGVAIGGLALRGTDDPCPRPVGDLAGVWGAGERDAVAARFDATAADGHATFARLAPQVDRAAAAWLDARRDACQATAVRHEQSAELLGRRLRCLRDWRLQLGALTEAFARATPGVIRASAGAVDALPAVARCSDPEALAAEPAAPPGLDVDRYDAELARIRALHLGGRSREALAAVAALAADPAVASYPPLAIRTALWQAEEFTAAGKLDEARAAARSAFDLALGVADKRAAAQAAGDIALLGAYDMSHATDALQWVHTGRALLAALDDVAMLDAKLANAEGNIDVAAGEPAAAQPALERAIADLRRIDPDHPDLGSSLGALGNAELDRGDVDGAERDLRDGLRRLERDFGPDHPEVASALINLALVHAARGHYRDAVLATDRAIAQLRRVLGPDHPNLAYAELARGEANRARGDRAAADADFRDAARIVRAAYGDAYPLGAQIEMAWSELGGPDAVSRARHARATLGAADPLSAALADATLARALGHTPEAIALARGAAARADALPTGAPAPRGIIYAALGELADDPARLAQAAAALADGAPDPTRLAAARFALGRVTNDATVVRAALAAFPRDGDPEARAAMERWLAGT